MPLFLTQVSYTPQAWKSLIEKPQNRLEVVRKTVEKLGGKVINGWAAFGDYDVILVSEMPDQVAAASFAMAIAAGGGRKVKEAEIQFSGLSLFPLDVAALTRRVRQLGQLVCCRSRHHFTLEHHAAPTPQTPQQLQHRDIKRNRRHCQPRLPLSIRHTAT